MAKSLFGYFKKGKILAGLIVAFFTFFIALLAGIGSEVLMNTIKDIWVAILLLLIIIALGIFFDIIGTAAAAVNLPPFNAKAAKKVFGAYQAVKITKNASSVANYCNDVIGDIAGTLSGAVGAGIVFNLIENFSFPDSVLTSAVMTSFIAAVTVGGKSLGKDLAIAKANSIILKVAIVLAWWENLTGWELFKDRR
jgi:CBS domain containing-hemolysin-like protein